MFIGLYSLTGLVGMVLAVVSVGLFASFQRRNDWPDDLRLLLAFALYPAALVVVSVLRIRAALSNPASLAPVDSLLGIFMLLVGTVLALAEWRYVSTRRRV